MYKIYCCFLFATLLLFSCKGQSPKKKTAHKFTNQLIKETSPYLLQHAHNPVEWHAWNDQTLAKAKKENKLLLISIGYAACHWCHVMEHESFENEEVATIMNDNFINIKIDREERPDIDQIYMNAVQLMTGSGGWPLNCIALPNGKPFWGGTYFPKKDWTNALTQLANVYKTSPNKVVEHANNLTKGIQQSELIRLNTTVPKFKTSKIESIVNQWSLSFDKNLGGINRAPKFPMPNNYHFLLRYAVQTNNNTLKTYTLNTLDKMALGGIFDHVNGGFSRYSTDKKWHIPHFEKMLYDNAQLVSLYSDAYALTKDNLYKETVVKTLDFVKNELTDKQGAFYSSLDADSLDEYKHLEEGAYYVWTKQELITLIKHDYTLFSEYYNVNEYGKWEKEKYHLIRKETTIDFANKHNISISKLEEKVTAWNTVLRKARATKSKPRLDDKTLTSWNALMLKGYVDAYRVFENPKYLQTAISNANFIKNHQLRKDGGLNHNYKNGHSTINAYLEDYAAVIEAYIALYEVTLNQEWLNISKQLASYCFAHFYDDTSKMFFFTSNQDKNLIARKMEIIDNVIPASNSILAKTFFKLSYYFDNQKLKSTSRQMLHNVSQQFSNYGSSYSNWLDLYLNHSEKFYEVVVIGENTHQLIKKIQKEYIPNKLIAGSKTENSQPLLLNRYVKNKSFIYICNYGSCLLPTEKSEDAIFQLKK